MQPFTFIIFMWLIWDSVETLSMDDIELNSTIFSQEYDKKK